MRQTNKLMGLALCVVILVCLSTMKVDEASGFDKPMYIGEYCWDTANGGFLRVGITLMGDGHFSFCGSVQSGSLDWAINGNLEVFGDSIEITWTDAFVYNGGMSMSSRVGQATMGLSTLYGYSNTMDMTWDGSACTLDHYTDILYPTSCDKSLSSDGVDKQEELINILKQYATTPEE